MLREFKQDDCNQTLQNKSVCHNAQKERFMMALDHPVVEIDTFYLCSVDGVAHESGGRGIWLCLRICQPE